MDAERACGEIISEQSTEVGIEPVHARSVGVS
jgi:hypothetical protein